jgi:hypothetical protein
VKLFFRTGSPGLVAAAATLLTAGCTGSRVKLPFDARAGDAMATAYKLRFKRQAGTTDRYQAKLDVRVRQKETGREKRLAGYQSLVRDKFESDEKTTAEITVSFTGKTKDEKFDRVVIVRRNVTRDVLEVAPDGTVKHNKRTGIPFQPRITPNFDADPATRDLYYIPMNELGVIACRKETPFHYAWRDSLCYLFPILPMEEVRVGDHWQLDVPVSADLQDVNSVTRLKTSFKFSDLRSVPTGGENDERILRAVIDYTYYAILDTRHAEDAGKLPPNAPDVVWRRFTFEGDGTAYFDIDAGKVVWKREEYRIIVEREYDRPVKQTERDAGGGRGGEDKPRELERMSYAAENSVKFSSRLLAPGERADERPSRRGR